jgi:predicted DNA binding protein
MNSYNSLIGKQVFMACNDKLIEVELLSEVLTFKTATYQFKFNGKVHTEEIKCGSSKIDNLFYRSVSDYTNGLAIKPRNYEFSRSYRQFVIVGEDSLLINAWVFENNKAVCKDVKVDSVVSYSELIGEQKNLRYKIITDTDIYSSVDQCYAFNKVVAEDIDGNSKHTNTGYMLDMLAYTDEQKKAIDKLRKAIEEVNKTCTFLCSDDGLYVVSGKHNVSDSDWAECNETEYIGHIYQSKAIALPHIFRNYADNPVLMYDQARNTRSL